MALNGNLTIRRDHLDLGGIVITLAFWFVLLGPWADLRAVIAPLFLFLLPGYALIACVKLELKSPVELVASSFVVSVSFIFVLRLVLTRLSQTLFSESLISGIAIWTLCLLAVAHAWDISRHRGHSITLERSDLGLFLLLLLIYTGMSIFVLRANYTPTPDELTYMLDARQFNLAGAIPIIDPGKIWLVNLLLTRSLWFISLASYLLVSATPPFSSQVLSVFFFSMLILATYRIGKRLLGGEVGLIAAILLAVSPSLLLWGSTVLLDLPLAVFLILGYGYFLEAVQMKGGKLESVAVGSFALTIVCFLLSSLIKLADPVLPALVYLFFVYLVWKSELPWKRLTLSVLIALPSIYLTFDALYNIVTYVVPNAAIHNLIRPFLPVSFFERFFAFFYQETAYKAGTTLSLSGILQGMYLAGFEPFLFTYAVLFMSIAGIIIMVDRARGDLTKEHGVFSMLVIGLASLLAALFLFSYEVARNVIYIYPFIFVAAAVGFRFSLQKRLWVFILSAAGVVVLIYLIESSMLGVGISLGAIPAPSQFTLSILSLNFLLGIGILAWKIFESILGRTSQSTPKWKGFSSGTGPRVAAIALVCLFCFSQFLIFTQTSPYRSVSNFSGLDAWLDSHIGTGDIIFTNGQQSLISLLNDTTLRSFTHGSVQVLPATNSSTVLDSVKKSSAGVYLVIFKVAEYTDSDSYSPDQFFTEEQLSSISMDTPNYQIDSLSAQASSTLSLVKISTINSTGAQISGYYTTLWQKGTQLASCFSPCSFSLRNGETYQIAATSFGDEKFSHWQNDSSTGFETVNVPNNSSVLFLTAVYKP